MQVPHLDGRLAGGVNMLSRGPLSSTVLSVASLADVAAQATKLQDLYIPLVSAALSLGHCGYVGTTESE